ncbi:Sporulation related domain-containing protein [Bradyrhizobium sp. Gha]|nr:Sporulation related domain-containing protein [Bradyrhizobium sp. Gha]
MAELARLIGQTDPFAAQGRPVAAAAPTQAYQHDDYSRDDDQPDYAEQAAPPQPGPPSWMRRANVQPQPAPEPDYPVAVNPVHPLHRYAAQPAAPEPQYRQPQAHQDHAYQDQAYGQEPAQAYEAPYEQPDPARYDDALYGRLESGEQDFQREAAYPDDPYAFQSEYAEADLDEPRKSRGGMMTVAAILALAVVGTGAAFAYKTYIGSPRSGEPPIIKADNTPTKIIPAPSDSSTKVPDRMVAGDGGEKIVPREEAPVDVNAKAAGPRVVFPALNQNANPPPVASVSPSNVPAPTAGPVPSNGTMPNNAPRTIKTVAVRGDQTDSTAPQAAAPPPVKPAPASKAAAAPRMPPTSANASVTQPLSLAPTPSEPPQRVAATAPTQIAPAPSGGGYVVQVSSQQSEDSAAASYRVLQSKYGSVLGGRSPVIKRVDLTDKGKGIVYRAFAGPYGSADEAVQACNNLKSAGLPSCFVQRN